LTETAAKQDVELVALELFREAGVDVAVLFPSGPRVAEANERPVSVVAEHVDDLRARYRPTAPLPVLPAIKDVVLCRKPTRAQAGLFQMTSPCALARGHDGPCAPSKQNVWLPK
jgi:hypothetical protein